MFMKIRGRIMNEIEKIVGMKIIEEFIEIEREKLKVLIEIKELLEKFVKAYEADMKKVDV